MAAEKVDGDSIEHGEILKTHRKFSIALDLQTVIYVPL